jgi:putative tryptophan/tyrosine transport system substrate-binding protein
MKRRVFVVATAAWAAIGWAPGTVAQSKRAPIVIGWLSNSSRESGTPSLAAFRQGLAELGWKEGSQVTIEERWAEGKMDRLPALARELAAMKPAVIVASPSSRPVIVAAKEAPHIPLVQASGGDLVSAGLAKTYAQPGSMVTGITNLPVEASEKYIEFLRMMMPKLRRVGFLMDPNTLDPAAQRKVIERAAQRLLIEPQLASAAKGDEIDPALASLAKQGTEALVAMPSPLFGFERPRILRYAQAQRWPVAAGTGAWVQSGALLSYGADASENFRRAAYYVDRILKGSKPGDLPLEQPRKFELVLNTKVAKTLGLKIPQELLLRADKVIE